MTSRHAAPPAPAGQYERDRDREEKLAGLVHATLTGAGLHPDDVAVQTQGLTGAIIAAGLLRYEAPRVDRATSEAVLRLSDWLRGTEPSSFSDDIRAVLAALGMPVQTLDPAGKVTAS